MKPLLVALVVLAFLCTLAVGTARTVQSSQTQTGRLSDGTCQMSHETLAGQVGLTPEECARVCIENGSGMVFVSSRTVTNPDFPGLSDLLGRSVRVLGDQSADAIRVSRLEAYEPEHGRPAPPGAGHLTDVACGLSHTTMATQAGLTDRECARACVERGSAIGFVTAVPVANPDFANLMELLGQDVELTGEPTDDGIAVSNVGLPQ